MAATNIEPMTSKVHRPRPVLAPDGDSRRPRSGRWRMPTVADAVGLALGVLGFAIGSRPIADNSFLTHLATGRLMAELGTVPVADPYSADFGGRAWTVQSWLASAVYNGLDFVFGPVSLPLFHGVLAAGVTVGLWYLTAPARQLLTRMVLVATPLALGGAYWSPRPLLIGLVGLVLVLLVVDRRLAPWLLVPTLWVWVNSHGSFPLAAVIVFGVAVGSMIDDRRLDKSVRSLLAWTGIGLLVSGLNPLGPQLWWFPVRLLATGEALNGVVEWEAPGFDSAGQRMYLALLVPLAVAARRRLPWSRLLPALAFYLFGFLAIRNLAPASIVVVAMIAPALADMAGSEVGDRRDWAASGLALLSVGGLVAGGLVATNRPALELGRYPVAAVDHLTDLGLVGPGRDQSWTGELVHRDRVGNYLIHRFGPSSRVFIDDRFDFYPMGRLRDHLILLDGGDFGTVLDDVDGDVVLWESDRILAQWLRDSPQWNVDFDDGEWMIACRRSSAIDDRCS